jgi:hypothetical protein
VHRRRNGVVWISTRCVRSGLREAIIDTREASAAPIGLGGVEMCGRK